MIDSFQKMMLTPEQIKAKAAAESARAGAEILGIILVTLALFVLAIDAVQRGWLTGLEALGGWALIIGVWLAVCNRKGGVG